MSDIPNFHFHTSMHGIETMRIHEIAYFDENHRLDRFSETSA